MYDVERWSNIVQMLYKCFFCLLDPPPPLISTPRGVLWRQCVWTRAVSYRWQDLFVHDPCLTLVIHAMCLCYAVCSNPLSPHDAPKASVCVSENRLNFPITRGFRMNISMKLVYQYMAVFFTFSPTSSHLHPLQVENCDSNSRLVVDGDDNVKSGLKGLKGGHLSLKSAAFYAHGIDGYKVGGKTIYFKVDQIKSLCHVILSFCLRKLFCSFLFWNRILSSLWKIQHMFSYIYSAEIIKCTSMHSMYQTQSIQCR